MLQHNDERLECVLARRVMLKHNLRDRKFQGRDYRLTDVHGELVKPILV